MALATIWVRVTKVTIKRVHQLITFVQSLSDIMFARFTLFTDNVVVVQSVAAKVLNHGIYAVHSIVLHSHVTQI